MSEFNINQILEQAPAKIAELASLAEESRFLFKEAEIRLKQVEAREHLSCKAMNPDMTVADLKATVEAKDEIYAQRMSLISHESEWKKALIAVDKWSNAYVSARKIASLRMEEMKSLHNTVS